MQQRDVIPPAKQSRISFLPALQRKAQFCIYVYGTKAAVVTVSSLPTEADRTLSGKYHNHQNPTINSLMPLAHHLTCACHFSIGIFHSGFQNEVAQLGTATVS